MSDDFEPFEPVEQPTPEPTPEPQPITRPVRKRPAPPAAPTLPTAYLLGCCLIDEGHTLDKAIAAGLTSTDFTDPGEATIFSTLRRMRHAGTPIATDTLVEALGAQFAGIGLPTIMALDQVGTTARAGWAIEQIADASERRRVHAVAAQITELTDLTLLPDLLARLKPRSRGTPLALRRVRAATPPPEPKTRLFLAGKPICTPGNITTLISRAKTGKTATLGAATAAVITAAAGTGALKPDNLGFTASNPAGHAVIVIDTEQSPFDAYTCYKRSLDRASTTDDPKWLYHYSLVGMSPEALRQALDEAIAVAQKECGSVFCLILDGVADFTNSVNDEAECNGFVNWLRERTVTHDCPAICVIHSNEGVKTGDDGRGHLGKQLTRKAESNLLLRKTDEITTITSEKQRKAPITEADGIAFRWSEADQRHISCAADDNPKKSGGRKRLHTIHEFWDCLPKPGQPPMTGTALHRFALQIADIKPNTFKDLLADAAKDGLLTRSYDAKTGYAYAQSARP